MNELYYYPGACSLAVHIALAEVGLPYSLHSVNLPEGEHHAAHYRQIHPLERVPALRLEDGTVLTEVGSLLLFIDEQSKQPTLPRHGLAGAACQTWLSLFTSGVHIPFAMKVNPSRFCDEPSHFASLQASGVKRGHDMLRYVDARLSSGGSVLDQGATLLDAYAFVFFLWGLRAQLPVTKLENYKRLAQAQVERPAVLRALKEEGLDQVPELIRALSSQDNVAFSGPS